uniref:Uncharacterized protein n=1 Tax=Glossina austeni TaxID=7395 RepID=A0A1A9VFD1_GLOAU
MQVLTQKSKVSSECCKGNASPLTPVSGLSTIFSDIPCSTYTYKIFFGPFEATEVRILKVKCLLIALRQLCSKR